MRRLRMGLLGWRIFEGESVLEVGTGLIFLGWE